MSNMPQRRQKFGYQSVEIVMFRVICNSTKKLNENFAVKNVSTSLNLGAGIIKLLVSILNTEPLDIGEQRPTTTHTATTQQTKQSMHYHFHCS